MTTQQKKERLRAYYETHTMVVHATNLMRPNIYLELGILDFVTINRVVPFVQKAIGVDISNKSLSLKHPSIEFHHMTTDEFFEENKDLKIDFAFIDADHSYETCLKDFLNCEARLNELGIIAMHDTYPVDLRDHWVGDCWKVVKYIKANLLQYETFTFPICPGLTLVRKAGWVVE